MTNAVRAVVAYHHQNNQFTQLPDALKQLPVLAIRKYAYEHGLAYFYLALGYDLEAEQDNEFEDLCVIIEQLVESYKLVQYRAMKLAKADNFSDQEQQLLDEIQSILDEQDAREFQVKSRLAELFNDWHQQSFGHPVSTDTNQPEAVPA
jgi:tRNA(Ile)-lysidine synthase TilS/MesJ